MKLLKDNETVWSPIVDGEPSPYWIVILNKQAPAPQDYQSFSLLLQQTIKRIMQRSAESEIKMANRALMEQDLPQLTSPESLAELMIYGGVNTPEESQWHQNLQQLIIWFRDAKMPIPLLSPQQQQTQAELLESMNLTDFIVNLIS